MEASAERRTRRFTADEVLRMVDAGILAEDEPVELIEGELVVVTPQGPPHASVTTALRDRLVAAYGAGFVVREDKPLIAGESSLPEPDIAVVRGVHRDFGKRHPRGDEALLVIEVARTSLAMDRSKAATYARAGVPIYWLLDLDAGRLEVHTDPRPDGRYGRVRVLAGEDEVALPERELAWRVCELLLE